MQTDTAWSEWMNLPKRKKIKIIKTGTLKSLQGASEIFNGCLNKNELYALHHEKDKVLA